MQKDRGAAAETGDLKKAVPNREFQTGLEGGGKHSGALEGEVQPGLKPLVGVLRTKRASTPNGSSRPGSRGDGTKRGDSEVAKKGKIDDEILDIVMSKNEAHDQNTAGEGNESSNKQERDRYLRNMSVLSGKSRNKHIELNPLVIEGALTTTQLLRRPESRGTEKSYEDKTTEGYNKAIQSDEAKLSDEGKPAVEAADGGQESKLTANDTPSKTAEAKDDELSMHSSVDSIPADAGVFAQPSVTIVLNTAPSTAIFISSKEQDANDAARAVRGDAKSVTKVSHKMAEQKQPQHPQNGVAYKGGLRRALSDEGAGAVGMTPLKEEASGALSEMDDDIDSPEHEHEHEHGRPSSPNLIRRGSTSSRASTPTFTRDSDPHDGERDSVALTGSPKPISDSPASLRRKPPGPSSSLMVTSQVDLQSDLDLDESEEGGLVPIIPIPATMTAERSSSPGLGPVVVMPRTPSPYQSSLAHDLQGPLVYGNGSHDQGVLFKGADKGPLPSMQKEQDQRAAVGRSYREGQGLVGDGQAESEGKGRASDIHPADDTHYDNEGTAHQQHLWRDARDHNVDLGESQEQTTEGPRQVLMEPNPDPLTATRQQEQAAGGGGGGPSLRLPRHIPGPFLGPGELSPDPAARFQHEGEGRTLVASLQPELMTFSLLMDMGRDRDGDGTDPLQDPYLYTATLQGQAGHEPEARVDCLSTPKHYNREKQHYDDYRHRLTKAKTELDMAEVRKNAASRGGQERLSTKLAQSQSQSQLPGAGGADGADGADSADSAGADRENGAESVGLAGEVGQGIAHQMRRYRRLQSASRDVESERILAREARRKDKEREKQAEQAAVQGEREARLQRGWLTRAGLAPLASAELDSIHDGLTVAEMSYITEEERQNAAVGGAEEEAGVAVGVRVRRPQAENVPTKHRLHALYQSSEDASAVVGSPRTDAWLSRSQQSWGLGEPSSDSLVARNKDLSRTYLANGPVQVQISAGAGAGAGAGVGTGVGVAADSAAMESGGASDLGEGVQLLPDSRPAFPAPRDEAVLSPGVVLGEGASPELELGRQLNLNDNSVLTSHTGRLQDSLDMGAFVPSHSSSAPITASTLKQGVPSPPQPHPHPQPPYRQQAPGGAGGGGSSSGSGSGRRRGKGQGQGVTLPKELPKWFGRKLGESSSGDSRRTRTANESLSSAQMLNTTGIPEKHYRPERSVMKPTVWKYEEVPEHVPAESQQALRKGGDLFRSTLAGSLIIEGHLDELSLSASFMRVPSVHGKAPPTIARPRTISTLGGRPSASKTSAASGSKSGSR